MTNFIELPPAEFSTAADRFCAFRDFLCVRSVIAGNTQGKIFLSKSYPQISILWNRMDAIYLVLPVAAQIQDEFIRLVSTEIAGDAARRYIPVLNITSMPNSGIYRLSEYFDHCKPAYTPRLAFEYLGTEGITPQINGDWQIVPIDRQVLSHPRLANYHEMLGWIQSFWRSIDDYLTSGIGYCAVQKETIGSWCLSVYAAEKEYEFGVASAREYRGIGLATAVSAACLRKCLAIGFTPHWHCDHANQPSVRIAEKLGFGVSQRYENLTLHIDPLIPKEI